MNQIKNIIFDLGGLFIDLDENRTRESFEKLGLRNFAEVYTFKKQHQFFDDFDKGKMPASTFRNEIRKHITHPVTDQQIDSCWNAMLLGIPEERMEWLKSVCQSYRIFLLSNTNIIHVDAFTKIAFEKFGKDIFQERFEKAYYSCNIGMRKPDAEIFEFVILDNALNKAETIFIDDSAIHVDSANRIGLTSYLFDPGKSSIQNFFQSIVTR